MHGRSGLFVAKQAEEIATVTKLDGESGRNFLRAVGSGGEADHFEDVCAFEADGGMILRDKFAAAEEAIFFTIEGHEHYRQVWRALRES